MKLLIQIFTIFVFLNKVLYANISGTIFIDFNLNGKQDSNDIGVSDVQIKAYCSDGKYFEKTTDFNGSFTISTSSDCIIEANANKAGYASGENAKGSAKPLVSLAKNGTIHNISLASPSTYSQGNPEIIVSAAPGRYKYDGSKIPNYELLGTIFYGPMPKDGDVNTKENRKILATQKDTGAIWGLAYAKTNKKIYSSNVIRRFTFAREINSTNNIDQFGAIYVTDINDLDNPTTKQFILLSNKEIGYDLNQTQAQREAEIAQDTRDSDHKIATYLGRAGFGGLDISEDEKYLYTVNMGTKELYKIEINNPAHIGKVSIPNPYLNDCNDSKVRPWAIKIKGKNIYIGSICENQIENDIGAIVQKFDGSNWSIFAKTGSLQYQKEPGVINELSDPPLDEPEPWKNWEDPNDHISGEGRPRYPILADIEFDNNGDLILGFIDRGSLNKYNAYNAGDIRRMCKTKNGIYVDETNELAVTQCPSHKYEDQGHIYYEYYPGEYFDAEEDANETNPIHGHPETSLGGLAQEPGSSKVILSAIDVNGWTQPGGFIVLSNKDYQGSNGKFYPFGFKVSSMVLVDSQPEEEKDAYFRKSGGFGDVELLLESAPIEIGNLIWEDSNANGILDANEFGIANVKIKLYEGENCEGTLVGEAISSENGEYYFGGIDNINMLNNIPLKRDKSYSICISLEENNTTLKNKLLTYQDVNTNKNDTRDSDAKEENNKTFINLITTSYNNHTLDFGFFEPASLGDKVWYDSNSNGIQDNNESGVEGVEISLLNENEEEIAKTKTDKNGIYLFENITPGKYKIKVALYSLEKGYIPTIENQGDNESLDSDINKTGLSPTIILKDGQNYKDLDIGLIKAPSIGDYVWEDSNANGIQEKDEKGIANVKVELWQGNTLKSTTLTNSQGFYLFSEVDIESNYTLKFYPPLNYKETIAFIGDKTKDSNIKNNEANVSITTVSNYTIDAGYYKTVSIGDYVWEDCNANGIQEKNEKAIKGLKVSLYMKDKNNNWINAVDANNTLVTPIITDNNGSYYFNNLIPGRDYKVIFDTNNINGNRYYPTLQNTTTKENDSNVNKQAEIIIENLLSDDMSFDAGFFQAAAVGDRVWIDSNANGIQDKEESNLSGVEITLLNEDGSQAFDLNGNKLKTISHNGFYHFNNLKPGKYMIETNLENTNYYFTRASMQKDEDNNNSNSDSNIKNAFEKATKGRSIIFDLNSGEDDKTWDIGVFEAASIGDYIWEDSNANGIQEKDEKGIENIKVYLIPLVDENGFINKIDLSGNNLGLNYPIQTTKDGKYLFNNLIPGKYQIKVEVPKEYYVTRLDINTTDDTKDSDLKAFLDSNTLASMPDKTLQSAEDNRSFDGGLFKSSCISSQVYIDKNENGIFDETDEPLAGVAVSLIPLEDKYGNINYTTTSKKKIQTVYTNNNGEYTFCDLIPGKYKIEVKPSSEEQKKKFDSYSLIQGKKSEIVILKSGDEELKIYAINKNNVSLAGTVWYDENLNTLKDENDTFNVINIPISLYIKNTNDTWTKVSTTFTDTKGEYQFNNLKKGETYKVKFELPKGYMPTKKEDEIIINNLKENTLIDFGIYCECNDYTINPQNHKELKAPTLNILGVLSVLLSLIVIMKTKREH